MSHQQIVKDFWNLSKAEAEITKRRFIFSH